MTTALYAGSFDPPTLGHLDIIKRSAQVCDEVIVGIGYNPNKKPFLALETRIALLQDEAKDNGLDNVRVEAFTGATVEYARGATRSRC